MSVRKICFAAIAVALLPAGIGHAETTDNPLPSFADGAPVILTGTIGEIRSDEFDMDYGTGKITVELNEWGWSGDETRYLKTGDVVTVSGRIDDDLFEGREVEADNLYLRKSYVYYYKNDMYPSYYMTYDRENIAHDGTYVSMRGTVSDIDGQEFTITGRNNQTMTVDVSNLDYDPLDDDSLQKISAGDRVHVYGEIDDGFFDKREIMADSVIVLSQAGSPMQN